MEGWCPGSKLSVCLEGTYHRLAAFRGHNTARGEASRAMTKTVRCRQLASISCLKAKQVQIERNKIAVNFHHMCNCRFGMANSRYHSTFQIHNGRKQSTRCTQYAVMDTWHAARSQPSLQQHTECALNHGSACFSLFAK